MDNVRPGLESNDLHQLRWALGTALAMLSASSAFFLDLDVAPWALAVVVAGVAAFRWPLLPAWIPRWVHRLAFPLITAAFVADLFGGSDTLTALVRVQLLLLGYRMLSYRKRRDDLQVVLLGLFLVVLTGVLTLSLGFAVQLFAFTGCALAFLLVTTLVDVTEVPASGAPAGATERRLAPAWAGDVRWMRLIRRLRAAVDWRLMALGVVLFGGVVAVTALLFTAIPRFELGRSLFLEHLITKKTRTGFSDSIRFGEVTRIQEDSSVAFTVDGVAAERLPGVPYWRMVVLDEHREGGFRSSAGLRAELARRAWQRRVAVDGGVSGALAGSERWRFYFEPGISRYLPLTGAFREIRFNRPMDFQQHVPLRMVMLASDPVELVGFEIAGMESTAVLPDPAHAQRSREKAETAGLGYWRVAVTPAERAQMEIWVREITGGESLKPEVFAARAVRWLASRHRYGLESELPAGSGDAVVRWLDGRGPGHCELFAASFALLARTAGHPTRLVTGFKGGVWNEFSGSLIVRNSMAHAWCELWDGAGAWIRVDPTPGSFAVGEPTPELAAAQQRSRSVDRGWGARLDGWRVFWYRRVVNFDQSTQVELVEDVRGGVKEGFGWFRAILAEVGRTAATWLRQLRSPEYGMLIGILFVALPLALGGSPLGGSPLGGVGDLVVGRSSTRPRVARTGGGAPGGESLAAATADRSLGQWRGHARARRSAGSAFRPARRAGEGSTRLRACAPGGAGEPLSTPRVRPPEVRRRCVGAVAKSAIYRP